MLMLRSPAQARTNARVHRGRCSMRMHALTLASEFFPVGMPFLTAKAALIPCVALVIFGLRLSLVNVFLIPQHEVS